MLVAHLMFAHMLADYTLQTNWLIVRKGQSWDGLALHGLMVFVMSVVVVPEYFPVVILPILIMSLVHTFQDWVKIFSGPRIKVHPFIPYILDQVLHYVAIVVLQVLIGSQLQPAPAQADIFVMALGAVCISVTRFYDATWWANWLDMIPYMNRWQIWGYAERLAMAALATVGLFFVAPLCILPRLFYAWRSGNPIWKQPRGVLEMGIGVIFSVILGLILRSLLPV